MNYLLPFLIFTILQSLFINGVKDAFSKGEIFGGLAAWMDKVLKKEWIKKPIFKCCKCMASVYGALTFFPFAIYLFGWRWEEIPVYIFDVGILVYLNYYFYKHQ